jgi:uncharacterized membrane protein
MTDCFLKKQNCCNLVSLSRLTITPKKENTIVELALLSQNSLAFLLRWAHLLAGITWVGLLYYFNFIQGEYFKVADGGAKSDVIQKMVPNALWWFRWAAIFTFLSGIVLVYVKHLTGMGIMIGVVMGIIMFLNVWLIIWPNQKIVIASAKQVAGGGEALPGAAAALGKAGLASRTNTLFSVPMLFFMASSVHLPQLQTSIHSASAASLAVVFGLIAVLALNGIFGKTGPITSLKGVIGSGFVLTAILYLLVELL